MRSDDVALDAVESKSECVVLDPSYFVCYGLRCLHFVSCSDFRLSPSSCASDFEETLWASNGDRRGVK
jgi:hypothetical protein